MLISELTEGNESKNLLNTIIIRLREQLYLTLSNKRKSVWFQSKNWNDWQLYFCETWQETLSHFSACVYKYSFWHEEYSNVWIFQCLNISMFEYFNVWIFQCLNSSLFEYFNVWLFEEIGVSSNQIRIAWMAMIHITPSRIHREFIK